MREQPLSGAFFMDGGASLTNYFIAISGLRTSVNLIINLKFSVY